MSEPSKEALAERVARELACPFCCEGDPPKTDRWDVGYHNVLDEQGHETGLRATCKSYIKDEELHRLRVKRIQAAIDEARAESWPEPSASDKHGGWHISTDFLNQVDAAMRDVRDGEYSADWETIEAVLLAVTAIRARGVKR